MIRLALFLMLCALPAQAERIVLGLGQDQVSITATFDGDDILIFGAIRRDTPPPEDAGPLGVIVTVEGPDLPVDVYRKDRRFGIWVNSDDIHIDRAPSFYAVATNAPLSEILRDTEDLRARITTPRAIRAVGAGVADASAFVDALIRIKERQNLYQSRIGAIDVEEATLFRVTFDLPANLTEGDYVARIFLTRSGRPIDSTSALIPVEKVGLERWLYRLAQDQSVLYGLLSLAIAIAAGWMASAVFAAFRR